MSDAQLEEGISRTDLLRKLAADYQDLNGSYFEILEQPPTALEFCRLVHVSRPVVIKGLTQPANSKWSDDYLISVMDERLISVAVTPNGHADAIALGEDGKKYFVEPHVQKMTMRELLAHLTVGQGQKDGYDVEREVFYLQSQNGNLFNSTSFHDTDTEMPDDSELEPLRRDILRDIPWASDALGAEFKVISPPQMLRHLPGKTPDAVNIWIGNELSITSVHSDPYENLYTVIRGEKQFTLFPPTEGWCLQERTYPHATYIRDSLGSKLKVAPSSSQRIRWSSMEDPTNAASLPEARPLKIMLKVGETLYLPAGWWHHVQQKSLTIAVNWWYDADIRGMNWVWRNFLRGDTEELPDGNE